MRLFLIIALLFFTACSYPKKTTPFAIAPVPPELATIYIYRLPTYIHSVNPDVPRFYVDDEPMGKLVIGGYYAVQVEPGKVDVTYRNSLFGIPFPWKSGRVKLDVERGKSYFVRFAVYYGMGASTEFIQMPANIGAAEITKTVLLEN